MKDAEQNQNEWNLEKLLTQVQDRDLPEMVSALCSAPEIHQPSHFWKKYAQLNLQQLQEAGLDNFKRTINQNYFNWVGGDLKEQWKFQENSIDNIVVKREDYPAPPHWKTLYNRECFVQPRFFEALYEMPLGGEKPSNR